MKFKVGDRVRSLIHGSHSISYGIITSDMGDNEYLVKFGDITIFMINYHIELDLYYRRDISIEEILNLNEKV